METKVFEFQVFSDGTLRQQVDGSAATTSLDELRGQGWVPLHWDKLSDGPNARYAVVMELRKGKGAEFSFGIGRQH